MQPIAVGVGLTVTILALTALLAGPHVAYLAPHTRVVLAAYWPSLTAYSTLAVLTLIVALYATARAAGLADLGRKSGSRGTVDPARRGRRFGAGRTDAAAGPGRF